jgi:hypothetical protein
VTFDDYDEADRYVERLGFPELMRRAVTAVQDLPEGFIAAGFSNGGGMAEYVATQRRCGGVLLISGALPVAMLGATGWPRGLPAQIHYTVGDPRRRQEWLDQLVREIAARRRHGRGLRLPRDRPPVHRRQPAGRVRRDGHRAAPDPRPGLLRLTLEPGSLTDPQPVPRIGYASVDRSDEFERFVTSRLVAKPRSHDQGDDEARGR